MQILYLANLPLIITPLLRIPCLLLGSYRACTCLISLQSLLFKKLYLLWHIQFGYKVDLRLEGFWGALQCARKPRLHSFSFGSWKGEKDRRRGRTQRRILQDTCDPTITAPISSHHLHRLGFKCFNMLWCASDSLLMYLYSPLHN